MSSANMPGCGSSSARSPIQVTMRAGSVKYGNTTSGVTLHQGLRRHCRPVVPRHHRSRTRGQPRLDLPVRPGFMACINAVLFGTLLYRSRLVPRVIPAMGLIGAPVLLTANMLTLFGHLTQTGIWSMLATLPVAAWELSVGFYLTFKGFKSSSEESPR